MAVMGSSRTILSKACCSIVALTFGGCNYLQVFADPEVHARLYANYYEDATLMEKDILWQKHLAIISTVRVWTAVGVGV